MVGVGGTDYNTYIRLLQDLYASNGTENVQLSGIVNEKIPGEMKDKLSKEYTTEEVKTSLSRM